MGGLGLPKLDHPRACGVYPWRRRGTLARLGSSPRVRGLPVRTSSILPCQRIIPARAGFTAFFGVCCGGGWDHPRACGVYMRPRLMKESPRGSSPRVRGLHPEEKHVHEGNGIIPARAGFTTPSTPSRTSPRDHPRACGVYAVVLANGGSVEGSSPRVRGLPFGQVLLDLEGRIIPARAGFTVGRPHGFPWGRLGLTDHPRACGVYGASCWGWSSCSGSSPRVRGLLW